MEQWERDWILQNLPYLTENIICNASLISHLESKDLARSEKEELEAKGNYGGNIVKTKYLLEILPTKVGAYIHLIKALNSCNQSGAMKRLLEGIKEDHLQNMLSDQDFSIIYANFQTERNYNLTDGQGESALPPTRKSFRFIAFIFFCLMTAYCISDSGPDYERETITDYDKERWRRDLESIERLKQSNWDAGGYVDNYGEAVPINDDNDCDEDDMACIAHSEFSTSNAHDNLYFGDDEY